ncbi:MAG: alpha/beta hydrolase [Caulobacter sp.]|nr:alpha/beta hydrolase [Caulobacter sp.]
MLRALILLCLTATGLALAAPAEAGPAVYRQTSCIGDFGDQAGRVTCGVLSVDETRGGRSSRRVAIPVAVVKASAPRTGAPPVFFLHGGPGGDVVESVAGWLRRQRADEMAAVDQDWVFLDQRGSGLATPLLDCGSVAMNDAGPLNEAAAQALIACGARQMAAGVDLSQYNERQVALDIQDLRKALGYRQIDLVGVSYGTSIAMAALRHAPQGVRAVVLDSPWPPEASWAQGGPSMVADAVRVVMAKCAADAGCANRYPTLRKDVEAMANRFLAGPQAGKARSYRADDLGGFLMDAAYSGQGARQLPADLAAMARGDFSVLEAHRADRSPYFEGQHLTHLCKEEMPFEDPGRLVEDAADDPLARLLVPSMLRYFEVCRAWPVGEPDPRDGAPQSSDVPALFLAAEIDPGCPPDLARAAVARFSKGQLFIAPNATHGVNGSSPCARRMIRAFLADPLAPVAGDCLAAEAPSFAFQYPET